VLYERAVVSIGMRVLEFLSREPFGRRKVCAASRAARPGTRYHGVHPVRTLRRAVPAGQLRVRPVGRREQLGQGTLHGGRRTRGRRVGRGAQRERELRLSSGKKPETFVVLRNQACRPAATNSSRTHLPKTTARNERRFRSIIVHVARTSDRVNRVHGRDFYACIYIFKHNSLLCFRDMYNLASVKRTVRFAPPRVKYATGS